MLLLLNDKDIQNILTPKLAVDAMEESLIYEKEGKSVLPARLNVEFENGWLRMMPGVFEAGDEWNIMGCKVMNLTKKRGLHYIILLYSSTTGELLSILDAAAITRIRTGAVSAVVAKKVVKENVSRIGLIGTGYEARGQLMALSSVFQIDEVDVYSRKIENREAFAVEMSQELNINVNPVESARQAIQGKKLVVMATKSPDPVIDGDDLEKNAVVLSIGSTRLDLRELDDKSMARSKWVVVDHKEQVLAESADIQAGLNLSYLNENQLIAAYDLDDHDLSVDDKKDLIVFKSSGTALQDLAVAMKIYKIAVENQVGSHIDEFPYLKPFSK